MFLHCFSAEAYILHSARAENNTSAFNGDLDGYNGINVDHSLARARLGGHPRASIWQSKLIVSPRKTNKLS